LTLLVSQLFHLRFALWAVLTAVLLTQLNVGRSLKATDDYLVGTLGGAIFAGVVGALIPHNGEISLAVALVMTLIPVSFLAAEDARFGTAPFTAVLVLLAPIITHLGSIASASERVIEVAVGCIVGLVVSYAVLPAHAYDSSINSAARLLDLMARALHMLVEGMPGGLDEAAALHVVREIDTAYTALSAVASEGAHERTAYRASAPDLAPLLLALWRLRDDFVTIGRVAVAPMPEAVRARLGPALLHVSNAAADYLRASSDALVEAKPESHHSIDAAFDDYSAAMAALRGQELKQGLPVDAVERIFALAFALDQLRRDLGDLGRQIVQTREQSRG
jgi:uncharacterized membrane protein YccC